MTSRYDKLQLQWMKEATELLDNFGVVLCGFSGYATGDASLTAWFKPDPNKSKLDTQFSNVMGVSGRGYMGESIALSRQEWKWIRPLLEELLEYRRMVNPT